MARPSLLLVLLAAGACTLVDDEGEEGGTRPNVVIVLADDMGYGDAGCYNPDSRIPTPSIDRLALEGMRFTDAHAPGAWCVPSRFGLLTGIYPWRRRNFHPGRESVLDEGQVTIASFLRDQGYATAMVGKWHLGFEGGPATDGKDLVGGPIDRGFDRFFGIHASLDIPPYYYIRDRTPVALPTERVAASASEGWTNIQGAFWRAGAIAPGFEHADVLPRLVAEAVAYLDGRASTEHPFFLYLALTAPHTPWLPSVEYDGASDAAMYGDFVAQVDGAVGAILDALDRNGQSQETLVIFTSDNGPVWYPADDERFGHRSSGGLRGMKNDAWEGGHRMPFVVRWPGRVGEREVCQRTVCFTDVLPTLADVVGVPLPTGTARDGYSIAPVFADPAASTGREVTVLKSDASVIRSGRWKLITHLGSGGFSKPRRIDPEAGGPEGQLYDLDADLGETRNRAQEEPELASELREELFAWLESVGARMPVPNADYRPRDEG